MNNLLYPNSIFDNSFKPCCSGKCALNKQNAKNTFDTQKFYPHSLASPQINSAFVQNQNSQQSNFYQNEPTYDYNSYYQNNFNAPQNNSYQNPSYQNWQEESFPNIQNPAPQTRQKNLFGGLDPQQLINMIKGKNSFSGLLGNLKNTNPQLSMLLSLMQNSQKVKKQKNEKTPEELVVEDDTKKDFTYKKVKDFYKENP